MTTLDLVHSGPSGSGLDVFFVEVFDRGLKPVPAGQKGETEFALLRGSEPYRLDVPAGGDYLVRVRRSAGKPFRIPVTVREGENLLVPLQPPGPKVSPHEWLWYQFSYDLLPRPDRVTALGAPGPFVFKSEAPRRLQTLWTRCWASPGPAGTAWVQEVPAASDMIKDENLVKLTLPALPGVLRFLQVGGEEVPRRLVALPPGYQKLEVIFSATTPATEVNGGLRVGVFTLKPDADLLLKAMTASAPETAGRLIEHAEAPGTPNSTLAELLLGQKFDDPIAAAVGGYFLLHAGEFDRLHGWPANLDEQFPWLPDGAVIHAWQLLSRPDGSDHDRARQRLLESWRRGLPVFTEGLRLLRDGLVYFAGAPGNPNAPPDTDVRKTLDLLQEYLAAADWDQPTTTFLGVDPRTPELKPITGVPKTDQVLTFNVVL